MFGFVSTPAFLQFVLGLALLAGAVYAFRRNQVRGALALGFLGSLMLVVGIGFGSRTLATAMLASVGIVILALVGYAALQIGRAAEVARRYLEQRLDRSPTDV